MIETESVEGAKPNQKTAAERVRVRYFLIAWLIAIIWLPGAESVVIAMGYYTPWYWLDIGLIYYMQGLLTIALALTFVIWRFPLWETLGRPADGPSLRSGLLWAAFLFIIAAPAVYIVFYPLSFVTPWFVYVWLIDLPGTIYFDNGVFPFIPNLLNVVSLCVVAPILEEVAFRGVILHRWAHKFGLRNAVLLCRLFSGSCIPMCSARSCSAFGMCILYLRFQSLWVPIISHGVYNFVAWLVELGYFYKDGPYAEYTLQDFQEEWWIAAIFAAIGLVWAVIYLLRRNRIAISRCRH